LLRHGEDWLADHPEKEYITSRYLKHLRPLVNMAFERLVSADTDTGEAVQGDESEETNERKPNLNTRRLGGVAAALKNLGAKSVIDLGCGEGHLLDLLVKDRQFTRIAGVDVSHTALAHAGERLRLERSGDSMHERVTLFQGSLTYKDSRFAGFDAACVVEVIEHLDMPRLAAFERVLFEYAKPSFVILTTPNREFNAKYNFLGENNLRHSDHRFEWTRAEFRGWASGIAAQYGYTVQFSGVGDEDAALGAPTQMGVFTLCA
jgi:3' terminal RNA ribose 2'-O-methyltransferase Hen1